MSGADKNWASGQIDWEKAAGAERILRILLREKDEKIAALEKRIRDLSEPVPPAFRDAFAEEG